MGGFLVAGTFRSGTFTSGLSFPCSDALFVIGKSGVIESLFKDHATLETILQPFDADDLDSPLRGKVILGTLGSMSDEMGDFFGKIATILTTINGDGLL
jgi:hypothetical protein